MALRDDIRTSAARWFEQPAVRLLHAMHVGPNMVTLAGLGVTAAAAHLISRGHLFYGGLVLLFASVMDMLDGGLARMTGQASPFGAALDSVADRLAEAIVFIGLVVYFVWSDNSLGALLAVGAMVASFMVSYTRARGEGLGVTMKESGLVTRVERIVIMVAGLLTGFIVPALAVVLGFSLFSFLQRMRHIWKATR